MKNNILIEMILNMNSPYKKFNEYLKSSVKKIRFFNYWVTSSFDTYNHVSIKNYEFEKQFKFILIIKEDEDNNYIKYFQSKNMTKRWLRANGWKHVFNNEYEKPRANRYGRCKAKYYKRIFYEKNI